MFDILSGPFRHGDQKIARGVGKGLTFNASGSSAGYVLGTNDPEVQLAIAALVRPGSVVYDLGANVGFLTVLAARLAGPTGCVEAFEPLTENVERLKHNVALNRIENVRVHLVAIGDREGAAKFLITMKQTHCKLAEYERSHDMILRAIEVPVRTLDSVRKEFNLPIPNVIKIDVEGAEVEVLRGAVETLKEARPLLLIEMHDTNQSLAEMLQQIRYKGFALGPEPSILKASYLGEVVAAHEDDAEGIARIEAIAQASHDIR